MNVLRRLPTRKLLAVIAGVLVAAGSVTAAAVAALGGSGPVPPAKSLAAAVHDSLAGPSVAGVTASISFTNRLLDSAGLPGMSPLLSGATGRLWAAADGRLRVELQSDRGDTELLVDKRTASLYDAANNTVYRLTLPARRSAPRRPDRPGGVPSVQRIQDQITSLMADVSLSGAIPSNVGGAPAYTVKISPKHSAGLLGSAALAWDAAHAIPLRVAVYAQGNSSPVLELRATQVSFGPVLDSALSISPPAGAKVVRISPGRPVRAPKAARRARPTTVSGLAAVAAGLPFKLAAPAQLAGLPRTSVKLLDWGTDKAALVTYGRHLGAIVVIERSATKGGAAGPSASGLPAVQINGAKGHELETALGTGLWFQRDGVSYIVAGSVPRTAAETAARGL